MEWKTSAKGGVSLTPHHSPCVRPQYTCVATILHTGEARKLQGCIFFLKNDLFSRRIQTWALGGATKHSSYSDCKQCYFTLKQALRANKASFFSYKSTQSTIWMPCPLATSLPHYMLWYAQVYPIFGTPCPLNEQSFANWPTVLTCNCWFQCLTYRSLCVRGRDCNSESRDPGPFFNPEIPGLWETKIPGFRD